MNRSDDLFPQPGGTPDPYWQRAFDDAFDTPPPRVWEGVERQLDLDESDGILPLWQHREGRRSMLFGRWSAGIAASLMLTALGWWAWHREDAIRPDVAVITAPAQTTPGTLLPPTGPTVAHAEATGVAPLPLPSLAPARNGTQVRPRQNHESTTDAVAIETPGTLLAGRAKSVTNSPLEQPEQHVAALVQQAGAIVPNTVEEANGTLIFTETTLSTTMRMKEAEPFSSVGTGLQPSTFSRSVTTRSFTSPSLSMQSTTIRSQTRMGALPPAGLQPDFPVAPAAERAALSAISNLPELADQAATPPVTKSLVLRQPENELVAANKEEKPTADPVSTSSKRQRQKPWISAGVATSSFNPAVAIRSVMSPVLSSPQGFAMDSPSAPMSTLQSQLGRAVAFQAGVGIPLGEHWSVESGVGYLNGQNEVQSPTRISSLVSSANSANTDNLYTDLVNRLANKPVSAYANSSTSKLYDYSLSNQASSYAATQQQVVNNAYQFVQVPVQVGYELRPRRKLGLALLTGMVSNWFVKNTVAESITVKAGDGVYRPVTLAGTAGMRLRYRPDSYWSASAVGTFQQNMHSLTRSDVSLQSIPQQVGLSFSVDRHF
ncbi:hypothetical protein [Fibrella aquatica]|uniref:hypothetical protein n=1 Tax=Fibrella aquatica TaxID=3242487 RepID=UPI003521A13E